MMKHLACIMDGNRRWAKAKGWLPWYGHRKGVDAAQRVMDFCIEKQIPYLSLYTFSLENFNRPKQETDYLFDTMRKESEPMLKDCHKKNIRIRFVGDRDRFPKSLIALCDDMEKQTENYTVLQVNLLFCYGARQEIIAGIKKIISKVRDGLLSEQQISEDTLAQHLWTHGIPEPDLIIRPGGVKRLSNFLLYQAAYSEFYFTDTLWPDIDTTDLDQAVASFSATQRNWGR